MKMFFFFAQIFDNNVAHVPRAAIQTFYQRIICWVAKQVLSLLLHGLPLVPISFFLK